ncbi:MAG: hypothetical protein JNK81_01280 [Anaerolineales bacterium]|nr:hypothetical protein [Anaerolineales bacterium]
MNWKFLGLATLGISLLVQALGAAAFVAMTDFKLIEQGDTAEYVTIADNLIAGRGYSGENVEPYRPTTSRGPGMLLVNIPFRLLFSESDLGAVVAAKLILLLAVGLTLYVAFYFEKSALVYLVAPILTVLPTIAYYFVNPYASSPTLLLAMGAIYLSIVLIFQGRNFAFVLLTLASIYAISSREAALLPLAWIIFGSLLFSFLHKSPEIRRYFRLISIAVLVGTSAFYFLWSYRNQITFGQYQFSSIQGFNLLHASAYSMLPYLDNEGRAEVEASLENYPIYITRYHESDQLDIANQQGQEGTRLIRKYPAAFVMSHVVGTLRGLLIFDVDILEEKLGEWAIVLVTLIQIAVTIIAIIGLVKLTLNLPTEKRLVLALIIGAGIVSLLSGASFGEPRFRISLEPMMALGCVIFFKDFILPRIEARRAKISGT